MSESNAIVHFDICGPEEAGLSRFYAELLGWSVTPQGPGYALVDTPGGLRGSIVGSEAQKLAIGVQVTNIEHAVGAATRLGGEVVMPPTDNGWVTKAEIRDPAGNPLTLIQGPAE